MTKEDKYRCKETLDIEDIIRGKHGEKLTKIEAIITYDSGRKEVLKSKLKINGEAPKKFNDAMVIYKKLSTVKHIGIKKS